MDENFNEKLTELLKTDLRFVDDEGELVVATIIGCARKFDPKLIKLLLGKPKTKKEFFVDAGGSYIFKIDVFVNYIADKNFFADSYTRFRNKIGLNIDNKFLRERNEVSLVWPYKDCILEGGQTDEQEKNRKEIFFNEVLAHDEITRLLDPKILTNGTRYTTGGRRKISEIKRDEEGVIRENLIVKGNNLLALHTLRKQFQGKVKLIYIDPPYNTGKDSFGYNDNFNHSTWLTFMSNRLSIAREFLRDDGVIFISCDDSEQAYLKVLCDEIFGRENFICNMVREGKTGGGHDSRYLAVEYDYILVFGKNINSVRFKQETVDTEFDKKYKYEDEYVERRGKHKLRDLDYVGSCYSEGMDYPITLSTGEKLYAGGRYGKPITWRWGKDKFEWGLKNGFIVIDEEKKKVYKKEYQFVDNNDKRREKTNPYRALVKCLNAKGTRQIAKIFAGSANFKFPKPEELIKYIFDVATDPKDIILDYHLGSGTTCAVAHKMGRQYIGIEQMDYIEDIICERLQRVIDGEQGGISKSMSWQGGDDFIFFELMQHNESYMDKIHSARSSKELIKLWNSMVKDSFLNWYVNPKMPKNAFDDFILKGKGENGLDKQKELLAEILDKNHLYVNLSEIDDKDFKVGKEDKKLNQLFHESK